MCGHMLQFLTNDIPEESPGDAAAMGRVRDMPGTCWWAGSTDSPGAAAWRPWGGALCSPPLPLEISRAQWVAQACLCRAWHLSTGG